MNEKIKKENLSKVIESLNRDKEDVKKKKLKNLEPK